MISLADLYRAYQSFRPAPDEEQRVAIEKGPGDPVFIVAGPGTGKTTCLTLRILKLILVDGVPPRGILATTFTRKAAAELRSRILGWGFRVLEVLAADAGLPAGVRERLGRVDVNQVLTGTVDSLCERLLREYREPGTQPPVVADEYVSRTLLLREGLFEGSRFRDPNLDSFLLALHGGSRWGWHVGRMAELAQDIWNRRFHDQIRWDEFLAGGPERERAARRVLGDTLQGYQDALAGQGMVDFTGLEAEVLQRLRAGRLGDFLQGLRVVLVDEYQDTNLLQEGIYFELARACDGALTVVGDDDQSLYRFRGATVELFSRFPDRYERIFGERPPPVFLTINYRSTQRIVGFVRDYVVLDAGYQEVRVEGKPRLEWPTTAPEGVPVLGMFRDDLPTLARDLARLIREVFRGPGYRLADGSMLQRDPSEGDVGDCALLCGSPSEYNAGGTPRLPLQLRDELRASEPVIELFNPRGQDLGGLAIVMRFGGLLLECLDPGGVVEATIRGLSQDILGTFTTWRQQALQFLDSGAAPAGLMEFGRGWAGRDPQRGAGWEWPRSVSSLELVYGLVHYFPQLHDDPEGQVYLEVFTRQLAACEQVGAFKGRVVTDPSNQDLSDSSIRELLRDFLGPIAGGAIKVNEELMETFPRDRLSILSVHQAKGLEFPLTIVDVGSDFRTNHWAHAFKRFPADGSTPHAMEDLLRPYCELGAPARSARDRAFDDLYRQFLVAYSRPRDVLLLVGLRPTAPGGPVSNVATGWARAGTGRWAGMVPFVAI